MSKRQKIKNVLDLASVIMPIGLAAFAITGGLGLAINDKLHYLLWAAGFCVVVFIASEIV